MQAHQMKRILGISLLLLQFCLAQENEDSLKYEIQEVVIVGTRTSERIIDIPYSVFRVDKKELSYGKKLSAKDVLADVPGLFLQTRYGNHDLRLSIRGFGTRSNTGVRGVRILQDGIPESEPDGETVIDAVDFTSLGGVEVVKGNLSSLYANAPGGVINFISDLYFLKNYVSLTNQIGSWGFRQSGFKTGIANDANRLFISYNYRNLDGFREHGSEYQHLLNSIYETYIDKYSTLTILGNWVDGIMKLPGSLTKAEFGEDPNQANSIAISQDFKRISSKGRLALKYKTSFDEDSRNEFELDAYGGIKELEKADNTLYSYSTRYSLGTLARFSSKFDLAGIPNLLTLGMDFAYQSGPITDFENLYGHPGVSVQSEYNAKLSNIGFYFLDHLSLIPEQFDIFFSSRYDRNVYYRENYIPYGSIDTSRVLDQFTPKVGLTFKVVPMIALYSSYGMSYDFPALSELGNNQFTADPRYSLNPDLKAQSLNNFEFGIKGNVLQPESEILRKLFFEVTYFNYLIKDEIVPYVYSQKTYFRNAARTHREGVEVGIKSEPFERIEMVTNYTYTHFRYTDYATTLHLPSGDSSVNHTGSRVPSVPKHILNFILTYEWGISENLSGILQWDCDYISDMFVNDANSEMSPGYFYGNILGGVNLSLQSANIIAYVGVNNIFDKRYAGFLNINEFSGRYYEMGDPRSIYSGIKLTFSK